MGNPAWLCQPRFRKRNYKYVPQEGAAGFHGGQAISVRGYTLWEIVNDPTLRRRAQDWIISKIEQGIIAPVIDRVFRLDQIVEAHAYMDSNRANGKLVVTVP
ncbi:MAG: zinc-binding dehydrogenase [Xanthobacteraceae bacterium]